MAENRVLNERKVYVTKHEYPVIGMDDERREVIEYSFPNGTKGSYAIQGFIDPTEITTKIVSHMRYFYDAKNNKPIIRGPELEGRLKTGPEIGLRILATTSNLGKTVSLFEAESHQEVYTSPITHIKE